MDPVLFQSGSALWRSPPDLVAGLSRLVGPFDLDPAATDASAAKAPRFWTPADDGLVQDWGDDNFLNPPWQRANKKLGVVAIPIMPWIRKAATWPGRTTLLIAARTDTAFFRLAFDHAELVMLVQGRLVYLDEENQPRFPATFPSAVLHLPGYGRRPRTRQVGYVSSAGEPEPNFGLQVAGHRWDRMFERMAEGSNLAP